MTQIDTDKSPPRHLLPLLLGERLDFRDQFAELLRLTVQMILTPAESRRLKDAEGDADRELAIIREMVATAPKPTRPRRARTGHGSAASRIGGGANGNGPVSDHGRRQPRCRSEADGSATSIAQSWTDQWLAYWSLLDERPKQQVQVMQFLDRAMIVAPIDQVGATVNIMQALRCCNISPYVAAVIMLGAGCGTTAQSLQQAVSRIREAIEAFSR